MTCREIDQLEERKKWNDQTKMAAIKNPNLVERTLHYVLPICVS